jgi:hypothetical protein
MRSSLLFKEDYINSSEDVDLSLEISLNISRYTFINFKIGDYIARSLGRHSKRAIKDIAKSALLNYNTENEIHPASSKIKTSLQ